MLGARDELSAGPAVCRLKVDHGGTNWPGDWSVGRPGHGAPPPHNSFRFPRRVAANGRVLQGPVCVGRQRWARLADTRCPIDQGGRLPLVDKIENRLVGQILELQRTVLCYDAERTGCSWAGRRAARAANQEEGGEQGAGHMVVLLPTKIPVESQPASQVDTTQDVVGGLTARA